MLLSMSWSDSRTIVREDVVTEGSWMEVMWEFSTILQILRESKII